METAPSRSSFWSVLTLALVTFVVGWGPFTTALDSDVATAWDAPAHEGLIGLTRQHLQPDPFGVFKEWFAGMPYPHFYPPLFHHLVAVASAVTGFGDYRTATVLLIAAILVLPGLVFLLAHTWSPGDRLGAWAAGLLAVHYVTDHGRAAAWGLGIEAFDGVGLWSQVFTLPFLLVAAILMSQRMSGGRFLAVGLCLGVTILGNPHVAVSAGLWTLGLALAFRRPQYLAAGLCAVLVSAWWAAPMIERHDYFPTLGMRPVAVDDLLLLFSGLFLPALLALLVRVPGSRPSLIVGILVLGFVTIEQVSFLPLQPHRHVGALVLLLCPLAGAGLALVARRGLPARPLVATAILLVPYAWFHDSGRLTVHTDRLAEASDVRALMDAIRTHGVGRAVVEHLGPEPPAHPDGGITLWHEDSVLRSQLAVAGHEVLTSTFRESALLSFFAVPLRNALAEHKSHFGIANWLVRDLDFLEQPPDRTLRRAADMGVTHWLICHPTTRTRIESARGARTVATCGRWTLHAIEPAGVPARILRWHPALVLANWNVKDRQSDELDVFRVAEGLFAHGGDGPEPYWAGSRVVEDVLPTAGPNTLVLVDYAVRRLANAEQLLDEHLRAGGSVVYDRERPGALVAWLKRNRGERVIAVRLGRPALATARRQVVVELAESLGRLAVPVEPGDVRLEHPDDRSLRLHIHGETPVPVRVNYAWGPDWHRRDGNPVRLSGPGMMMTYGSGTVDLVFEVRGRDLWNGLSVAGVLLLLAISRMRWVREPEAPEVAA